MEKKKESDKGMRCNQNYEKTLTGSEWDECACALTLQMSDCKKEIARHENGIKNLTSAIKSYDTVHYKIKGFYHNIKPDCYKEDN